jgi:hypothetical protein
LCTPVYPPYVYDCVILKIDWCNHN